MKKLILGLVGVCAFGVGVCLAAPAEKAKRPAKPAAKAAKAGKAAKLSPKEQAIARARPWARFTAGVMAQNHLSRKGPNDLISQRAWTNLLEACDSDHMVFLASDIEMFELSRNVLDDALRVGDFSFAFRVQELFRERLAERTTFVTNLLAKGTFDFNGTNTYTFAREGAPWPAEGASRDALWTARVNAEVLDAWLDCETGGVKKAIGVVRKSYTDGLATALRRKPSAICDAFILAVVSAYDAHTLYLTRSHYDVFKSQMDLELCGIGAEWNLKDGQAKVKRVMPGGPLAKDGHVKAGDVIVGVAPKGTGKIVPLSGKSEEEVVSLFRGKKGAKLTLDVRHADGTRKQYTLVRGEVPMEDEAASSKVVEIDVGGVKRKAGYLRLPSFYSSTAARGKTKRTCSDDLRKELEKLNKANVCGVLFDLRNNNGGSLDDAVKVIGLFVRSGPAVRMRTSGGDTTLPVPSDSAICEVPVVVMTSRGSASAGELVPATLQDLSRAVVVGDDHTFGKGTAQTVRAIGGKNAGALVITDGRFYRVTGGSTQFKGVESDIIVPTPCEDTFSKGERGLDYPLPWDEIAPSAFKPSWDLNRFIPELRAASAARLAKSAAWAKHLKIVNDAKSFTDAKVMPLNKKARKLELDRKEAVEDEIERLEDEGFDPAKREKDVVLDEGLNILADLVHLNKGRTLPKAAAAPAPASGLLGGLNDD